MCLDFKRGTRAVEDAVKIGAKVLWLQLGIRNEEARKLELNKIEYIENKCTKWNIKLTF